ncbi:tail fiber protein [Danxiaibacter flavus]|uniref:Tail fiber protein n=1 Tax=Danxiaibacter flavus TaxID=3049108 RepID=A0ABV3ZFX8_9BACT|nr:tail fiber protein [Chitinophagaceae bacterium DXS]
MEGTMAEIRCFAANFAPKTWALCNGQTLAIAQNQALFALLGTVYGGDGIQTFSLPDFRSRIPVGTGTGPVGTFVLGQKAGEEFHTLLATEMPAHNHPIAITAGTGQATANITLNGTDTAGTLAVPGGNLLGADDGNGNVTIYASGTSTVAAMAAGSVTISNITAPTVGITLANAGGNLPHSNIQPVLGMNYIICMQGLFPSRN